MTGLFKPMLNRSNPQKLMNLMNVQKSILVLIKHEIKYSFDYTSLLAYLPNGANLSFSLDPKLFFRFWICVSLWFRVCDYFYSNPINHWKKKEINLWNWYLFRVCSTQISNWNLYSRCWWSWRIVGKQLFLINSLVVCSINQNRLTLWSLWTFLFGILRENEKNHSILLAFVMLAVS